MRTFLLSAVACTFASAQKEVTFASFGQRHSLELGHLPNWALGGSQAPQVLTDKVIFTPPYPGEARASAWTTSRLGSQDFTVDTKFLVNGGEHAGGNLQIWYTREGEASIHSDTLYTVDKFTGLVIVVDQHGGPAGGIRGFLNDGTMSFRNHPHLDTAAFGHCDYAYRNRGIPSKLQIKHDINGLEVNIDGRLCFKTDKVSLPSEYFLGITASSSASPDSFEISQFITTTPTTPRSPTTPQPLSNDQKPIYHAGNDKRTPPSSAGDGKINIEHVQDMLASNLKTSTEQFEDVHNRLQSLGHNTERLFGEYMRSSASMAGRIEELHSKLARFDQLRSVESQISNLEKSVRELRQLVEGGGGDMRGMIGELHQKVQERHDKLEEGLPGRIGDVVASKGPSLGLYLFYLVCLQVGGLGVYVWWKKRGDDRMKGGKYL